MSSVADQAKEVLQNLIGQVGCEGSITVFAEQPDEILLHVDSPQASLLIGKNGQVLDALQLILVRILQRRVENPPHVVVDIERYRERRKDRLLQQALEAAEQATRSGRPVQLPPMGSADRRIVHQALQENPGVQTHSVESQYGDLKCVVVSRREASPPPVE